MAAWAVVALLSPALSARASTDPTSTVRLPGHVLPAAVRAVPVAADPGARPNDGGAAGESLVLTLTLKREDQSGFDAYLREIYRPQSPSYRRFLSQTAIADRFGPSRDSYDRVVAYLQSSGLEITDRSANRLTVTAKGTREKVERAFAVRLADYRDAGRSERSFHAADADPALPADIATRVAAVTGLSNLASPRPTTKALAEAWTALVSWVKKTTPVIEEVNNAAAASSSNTASNGTKDPPGGWLGNDGTGQTIGLLEFDTFDVGDVVDYLELTGLPAAQINKLSQVHVGGGASPGANQSEVLLDIDAIMSIAPGAEIVVYDGPFAGKGASFQQMFNAMIDDGVTIISNSWAYCEDQTTAADVESIDAILQNAAMAGITVLNGSGDTGSTCLDGSPNTVAVPAGSPSATAVGGSTLSTGATFVYAGETWWDGSAATPPTGQGGFGVSKFFARPAYQDGFTAASKRSVPDVVVNADPARGVVICQANAGGCPSGALFGGTSVAAPIWAAFVSILNQAHGSNLGALNPLFYPLADTDGFHDAASMASDFAHVGLGSPNLNALHLQLLAQSVGAVDAAQSEAVHAMPVPGFVVSPTDLAGLSAGIPADGATEAVVVVRLRDGGGNTVGGKTITLVADGGEAVISPPNGVSTQDNGTVIFTVTDLTAETVTFTATDTSDGIVLDQKPSIDFAVPPASAASIGAFPLTVTADGIQTTTITVTLKDILNRPTPGKLIALSQGDGHSVIQGPNPSVTDIDGKIVFTAADQVNETVTYTAVDVTDGDLEIPGSQQVTFNNGSGVACGSNTLPTAADGYSVAPFATGFAAGPLSFGNVNFGGCSGANGPAFRDSSAIILNFRTGDVFKLPAGGGVASSAAKLGTVGPTLGWPVVGKDGRLYASRVATTGDFTTGAILELDPDTGQAIRAVATNLKCPQGLAVDPLSGDLFVSGACFGAGSDDPAIHRVHNPGSATPTVDVYANLPTTPNGNLAFAPDGTLYAVSGYLNASAFVVRVSGTDKPQPPTLTTLTGVSSLFWTNIGEVDADGHAISLITLSSDGADLRLTDITTDPPTNTTIAHGIGGGFNGPDGCLYAISGNATTIYKIGDADGGCRFAATSAKPTLALTPATVAPDPAQGTEQSFTARLVGIDAPEGTAVFFTVSGANPQVRMIRADALGEAVFTYAATQPGKDVLVAAAKVEDSALTSGKATVTWTDGKHTTFLTLNPSAIAGVEGQAVEVTAALVDVSLDPREAVEGATVDFDLDGAQCSGVTDASGIATCSLTPPATALTSLTATFAGDSELLPAEAVVAFNVVGDPIPSGTCGDPTDDGFIRATDALFVLRTAVGSVTCALCVCDADGSETITASDALRVLRVAVGLPVPLDCPACGMAP